MSLVYVKENSYDKAIELLYEGIALSEKYSDAEFLIRGYSILEDIYIELNDNNKLEEIYLILVEILEDIDLNKVLGIYIKLSLLYMDMGKHDKSKEILHKANNVQKLFYLKYVSFYNHINYYKFLELSCSKNDIMMTT